MIGGDAHCIMMEGDCCYIEISFFLSEREVICELVTVSSVDERVCTIDIQDVHVIFPFFSCFVPLIIIAMQFLH